MTTTGRITLGYDGTEIISRLYASPSKRDRLIEGWKKLYGPAFKKGTIIDVPDPHGEIFPGSHFKKGVLVDKGTINRGVRKFYPAERGENKFNT